MDLEPVPAEAFSVYFKADKVGENTIVHLRCADF